MALHQNRKRALHWSVQASHFGSPKPHRMVVGGCSLFSRVLSSRMPNDHPILLVKLSRTWIEPTFFKSTENLYGLKQAGQNWYLSQTEELLHYHMYSIIFHQIFLECFNLRLSASSISNTWRVQHLFFWHTLHIVYHGFFHGSVVGPTTTTVCLHSVHPCVHPVQVSIETFSVVYLFVSP